MFGSDFSAIGGDLVVKRQVPPHLAIRTPDLAALKRALEELDQAGESYSKLVQSLEQF